MSNNFNVLSLLLVLFDSKNVAHLSLLIDINPISESKKHLSTSGITIFLSIIPVFV